MPIPFGFGIGDVLALSKLIYKIVLELKKNSNAAPDFQLLLVELESLDRNLKVLQKIEPVRHELRRLDAIKALALACQRPLEEFLIKIKRFEDDLGACTSRHNRVLGFPRRLQWAMKYGEEVKSLRARLAPNIATITILLMTQTIDTLSDIGSSHIKAAQELDHKVSSQNMTLDSLKQAAFDMTAAQGNLEVGQSQITTVIIAQGHHFHSLKSKTDELLGRIVIQEQYMRDQAGVLKDIQASGITINSQSQEIHTITKATQQDTEKIKTEIPSILQQMLNIMNIVTAGLSNTREIVKLLKKITKLMNDFSVKMRQSMRELLLAFANIHRLLIRLEHILPKHIDLPIILFRDVFNHMMPFPFDLCREWQTFQKLVALAFEKQQGLHRIHSGHFYVTSSRIGRRLDSAFWHNAIQPHDELSMTMVLDDIEAEDGFCPFKSCGISTKDVPSQGGW